LSSDTKKLSLFEELKRRNVYRVGLAYVVFTWLALQVIDTLGPIIGLPDWTPKLVLTILAIGFPAVMLFAWAYELTPEGIKREKDVDRTQSITDHTGQRLDRITIGVLLITVGILLVDKFFISDTPAPEQLVQAEQADEASNEDVAEDEDPSIAVLPFVNMSDDESSTYFSDGLADTMLHMLAQVDEIRVAARTSSFQFRDQAMDIGKIGEQLNVGTVLEGSVQRAGDKIRVTAQLIDVENGFHLWSGNYDRDLNDVFAIQDEIANEVVTALKVSLLGEVAGTMDRDQTDNLDAYTEYLLGINRLSEDSSDSLRSALVHLQASIEHDPEYSRGWSTLGHAYLEAEAYGIMPRKEAAAAARDAASRALELVPESSEALAVLGMSYLIENQFDEAGNFLEKAVESGPNDIVAVTYYGQYLLTEARPKEAIAAFEKATRLDPLAENAYLVLAGQYMGLNQIDEALTVIKKMLAIDPDNPNASGSLAFALARRGEYAEAIHAMQRAHELDPADPEIPFVLATMYLAIDLPEEAGRWIDRAAEIDPMHPSSLAGPVMLNYYLQNDNAENAQLARELLDDEIPNRRGARGIALRVMLDYARESGNVDPLLGVLDNLYPHLFDNPPTDLDRSFMGVYFAGTALIQNGDTEQGQEFLSWVETESEPFLEIYGVDRNTVNLRLEMGDRAGALEALDEFVDRKFDSEFNAILFERDPIFDAIRDEPTFVALMQDYERNAAEQRQLLQAMNAD